MVFKMMRITIERKIQKDPSIIAFMDSRQINQIAENNENSNTNLFYTNS
jgi:hypothetical protein